ncbi:hypothetical protein [Streptomyces sp. NPDC047525]|uniref:hypothetical protein n=1 Tax=Streptomyces sp. NPDC047525 TaxID=3155264 RepID=UPI0033E1DF10
MVVDLVVALYGAVGIARLTPETSPWWTLSWTGELYDTDIAGLRSVCRVDLAAWRRRGH